MAIETDVRAELLKRLNDYHGTTYPAKFNIDNVQFKFLSIDYDSLDEIKTTPTQLRRHRIDNPSNAEITSRFTESAESHNEFTWSITEGLKVGAEVTFKVTAPLIGESDATASTEISLESTQEQKVSRTEKWEQEVEVRVPAKTSIEATTLLEQATINTSFTITLIAFGNVLVEAPTYVTSGLLERGYGMGPGTPLRPFLADENSRKFKAKGVFKGVNGLYISVTTKPIEK